VSFFLGKQPDGRPCAENVRRPDGEPFKEALNLDLLSEVDTHIGQKEDQEDRYVECVGVPGVGPFYGVFDGHGGALCAEYVSKHLHRNISSQCRGSTSDSAVRKAVVNGFAQTDKDFVQMAHRRPELVEQGATAVTMMVLGDQAPSEQDAGNVSLVLAHVGDSRATLCRAGQAVRLTRDHKPSDPEEKARILAAGGMVVTLPGSVARVTTIAGYEILTGKRKQKQGTPLPRALAVSRSIGDSDLKMGDKVTPCWQMTDMAQGKPLVSSEPVYTVTEVTKEDAFVILACDGIWDVLSDQQAVDVIKSHILSGDEGLGAAALVKAAADKGSGDNLSVIVVAFGWVVKSEALRSVAMAATIAAAEEEKEEEDEVTDLYG